MERDRGDGGMMDGRYVIAKAICWGVAMWLAIVAMINLNETTGVTAAILMVGWILTAIFWRMNEG